MKSFQSPDGDHLTLVNVFRRSNDFLVKKRMETSIEKSEKLLRKWCKENYINNRSLKHACDIHRLVIYCYYQVKLVSNFWMYICDTN